MKIIIDAMGGDNAPEAIVKGSVYARDRLGVELLLVGRKEEIENAFGDNAPTAFRTAGRLMAEGCTHHRQCDDIGTVKLPRWIQEYTGKKLQFETCSGGGFPEDLSKYKMVVHCGGCTLSKKEMAFRIAEAKDQNVPIVNYGTLIAGLKGVLERSIAPFR